MLVPPVLLLNLFVVVVMFSIGLRVSGGELLDILRKRSLIVPYPPGELRPHTGHRFPARSHLPPDIRRQCRRPAALFFIHLESQRVSLAGMPTRAMSGWNSKHEMKAWRSGDF